MKMCNLTFRFLNSYYFIWFKYDGEWLEADISTSHIKCKIDEAYNVIIERVYTHLFNLIKNENEEIALTLLIKNIKPSVRKTLTQLKGAK